MRGFEKTGILPKKNLNLIVREYIFHNNHYNDSVQRMAVTSCIYIFAELQSWPRCLDLGSTLPSSANPPTPSHPIFNSHQAPRSLLPLPGPGATPPLYLPPILMASQTTRASWQLRSIPGTPAVTEARAMSTPVT